MIDAHRGAFEYDWRARFHLPLEVVGDSMAWGEALRLTQILGRDPSSAVASSIAGWQYPLSREGLALLDLFDLMHTVNARKRPAPSPRPWVANERKTRGTARLTVNELRSVLEAARAN